MWGGEIQWEYTGGNTAMQMAVKMFDTKILVTLFASKCFVTSKGVRGFERICQIYNNKTMWTKNWHNFFVNHCFVFNHTKKTLYFVYIYHNLSKYNLLHYNMIKMTTSCT